MKSVDLLDSGEIMNQIKKNHQIQLIAQYLNILFLFFDIVLKLSLILFFDCKDLK